jgi:hypothetical protein
MTMAQLETYDIPLTEEEVNFLGQALDELPGKISRPMWLKLQNLFMVAKQKKESSRTLEANTKAPDEPVELSSEVAQ